MHDCLATKENDMKRTTYPVVACLAILLLSSIAHADSKTVTYKISLTIPNSIQQTNALEGTKENPNQLVQTQQVTRQNQTMLLQSIVAQ